MSEFKPSMAGIATSGLRVASNLMGGIFGRVASGSYEIERAIRGPARDKALQNAVEEAKPNFKQCPKCSHWVCRAVCWNERRGLCHDCAPNVETELSAAQAQVTVDQVITKVRSTDLTKNIDVTTEATALCPHCGARTQGGKFCPECGKPVLAKLTCSRCGSQTETVGAKFCPECGNMLS